VADKRTLIAVLIGNETVCHSKPKARDLAAANVEIPCMLPDSFFEVVCVRAGTRQT